jgi:hypothetical protein
MDAGKIFGRGISFPMRVGSDGRIVWSEGEQNIREAIRIILMTELGERLYLRNFGGGLGQFLFEPNSASTRQLIQDRVTKALAQWEPRIAVESVSVEAAADDGETAVVTITYRLVANQSRERISLNVTLSAR